MESYWLFWIGLAQIQRVSCGFRKSTVACRIIVDSNPGRVKLSLVAGQSSPPATHQGDPK
jgi:hypothetical protein